MECVGYRHSVLYKFMPLVLQVVWLGSLLAPTLRADCLYLKDGSVLVGKVEEGTSQDYLLSSACYGTLSIRRADVVYRQSEVADAQNETYVILDDALTVVASCRRDVPKRMPDKDAFHLLVRGEVQSVTDLNGGEIPFQTQAVGENSLVSVAYNGLASDAAAITVTTLDRGLLRRTPTGLLSFQVHTVPAQDERLQVIVKYPKAFKARQVTPDPAVNAEGIIVWEQNLRRQQHFSSEVQFAL